MVFEAIPMKVAKEISKEIHDLVEQKGYTVLDNVRFYEEDGLMKFSISIDAMLDDKDIPDEIQKYRVASYDIDRAIEKGNTSKSSYAGAVYELALRSYMNDQLRQLPEYYEITEHNVRTLEELKEYDDFVQKLWTEQIIPKAQKYIDDLEENYA